ncbi:hypothetical protein A2572_01495 [Candidatus Collierbacteria bacterium RIFOXYD1_FULL_40_9]|uniref:Methyltransferase type 11 domain-containing protein n=1 Tax=Candidatus Collierbacteria bacterium RIFOXYD1_FULL_40_9 TaxID=1817731 RepID=A0A1F5FVN2_9BACT|nr:MAG: hypothetical protein A2572_01495 [Candidatus Collierbacteria bacterium RIFOXYD1_FULL_40_9]
MSTNNYLVNGKRFGWGPGIVKINPDKANLLKKYAKGKCLDLGFGSGIYTKYLYDLGHEVTALDNQTSFVETAIKNYPDITFMVGKAEKLPFANNQYDTVVAFDILEHIDDKKTLTEIFRVTKRLIFSVPLQNQEILLRFGLSHAHYLDQTHLRTYTLQSAKELFPKKKYKRVFLKGSLPLSISGLLIDQLSNKIFLKKLLLKSILKPFLPEPPLFSTIFGVIDRKTKP